MARRQLSRLLLLPQRLRPLLPIPYTLDDLLRHAEAGDGDACDELYRQMVRRVLSSCRRLLTDRTEAEDVAQDVFLEVWMKAANFDAAGGSATAWILGIAHHRAVDRIRTSGGARRRNVSHHHHHHHRHHHRPSPADAA